MHMYQGKGRWGSNAEVPALTWLVLNYDYQNEVRSIHESIYPSLPNNYTTMVPLSTSQKKARHSTHAYLGEFNKFPFKLSNNQAKLSKQSITVDTAILIVLLTLQGCTTYTHDHQLPPLYSTPFKGCRRGCSPQPLPHSRSSPRKQPTWVGYHYREPGRFTEVDPDDVCVVHKPVSDEPFSHLAARPQNLPELRTTATSGHRKG